MKLKKYSIRFTILAAIFFASTLGTQASVIGDHYSIIKKKRYKKRYRRKSRKSKTVVLSEQKKWQTALAHLGYYHGDINGNIHSFDTHNAIVKFQKAHQVPTTGSPSQELKDYLSYIYSISSISKYLYYEGEDKRSNGKKYQAALKVHGFYHSEIDGVMGSGTKESILAYKQKTGVNSQDSALSYEEKSMLVNSAKERLKEQQSSFQFKRDTKPASIENNNVTITPQKRSMEESTPNSYQKTSEPLSNSYSNTPQIQNSNITALPQKSIMKDHTKTDSNVQADEYNSSISDDIANIAKEIIQSSKEVTAQ